MVDPQRSPKYFITHSFKDAEFARRLADDLAVHGFRGFFDIYSIKPGDNFVERIETGLDECDVYVPALSFAALESPWCKEEIRAAIALSNERDRDGRPRIVPILIENCHDKLPILLRSRLYILFVGRYDDAFAELLGALGVAPEAPPAAKPALVPETPRRSFADSLRGALRNWPLNRALPPAPPSAPPAESDALVKIQPRVLMVVYNPIVDARRGKKLIETCAWNDPDQLAAGFIQDLHECSGGLANYRIVERVETNEFPAQIDGFQYRPQEYLDVLRAGQGFHDPDMVDYSAIIHKFDLLNRISKDEFDEVWLFGPPYSGFYQSAMAGKGAFFCNAPSVSGTNACPRRFVLMGLNYERGVGEFLESFAARADSIMREVYRAKSGDANLFDRFTLYDQVASGRANVGTIHYAPNSMHDYDWGSMTPVQSCADDWLQFPNLPNPPNYRMMSTKDWGNGDIREHHKWWLKHLPKAVGTTDGVSNNWWKYIVDPNQVR